MLPFISGDIIGGELSKHGIHNARYREHGEREIYYDGVILRARKSDQTTLVMVVVMATALDCLLVVTHLYQILLERSVLAQA